MYFHKLGEKWKEAKHQIVSIMQYLNYEIHWYTARNIPIDNL